jgi:outer membrane protein assembly factor BamA
VPHDVTLGEKSGYGGLFAPMMAFDNMRVEGLSSHGLKFKLSSGLSKSMGRSGGFSELEAFGFYALSTDFNFASHLYGATTSQNSVGSLYYLGGFDSVRGLPDGIKYGNKILYGNFEARIIAARFHYAHIQPVVFYDSGSAWMNDHDPLRGRETSVGAGVRIAIPQIYRFVVRVDYGKSVGSTRSQGLSIGLNQFFQPYKMVF